MKKSIVILASGGGSLAQAIMDAVNDGELDIQILEVISDKPGANVLERAEESGIKTFVHPMLPNRAQWDSELMRHIESLNPDLVVSVGFMRILSPEFVTTFKVINTHPALLPKFPGAHPVRDALAAGVAVTGATVHWVDSGVDSGKVIAQTEVDVLPEDSESTLHERIKIVEQGLIVETLKNLLPTLESDHV
ncbi:MAG: phosphoribosylglycinamide formyltransferase [Candidatus Nanopelagicaceae bacterium]|jgi:phosphoribosylglycinamide formyltransferase-1